MSTASATRGSNGCPATEIRTAPSSAIRLWSAASDSRTPSDEAAQRVALGVDPAAHRRERPLQIVGGLEQRLGDAGPLRLDDPRLLALGALPEPLVVLEQRRVRAGELLDARGLLGDAARPARRDACPRRPRRRGRRLAPVLGRAGRLTLGREPAAIDHLHLRLAPGG